MDFMRKREIEDFLDIPDLMRRFEELETDLMRARDNFILSHQICLDVDFTQWIDAVEHVMARIHFLKGAIERSRTTKLTDQEKAGACLIHNGILSDINMLGGTNRSLLRIEQAQRFEKSEKSFAAGIF